MNKFFTAWQFFIGEVWRGEARRDWARCGLAWRGNEGARLLKRALRNT